MFKKILFLLPLIISCNLFASEDCSKFKFNPDININNIDNNNVNIKKSEENLIGKLGYIESGVKYSTKIMIIPIMVRDGFCLSLRSIDINIGFSDFDIVIDKRLKENSCAYNIVLKHEKDHMQNDKNVIKSNIENIKESVLNATLSIEPVFVPKEANQQEYEEKMQDSLKNNKNIVDIINKIKIELDQGNEEIDYRGDNWEIWQCKDFFEEMKESYGNISID
jgi:hypothetical protein